MTHSTFLALPICSRLNCLRYLFEVQISFHYTPILSNTSLVSHSPGDQHPNPSDGHEDQMWSGPIHLASLIYLVVLYPEAIKAFGLSNRQRHQFFLCLQYVHWPFCHVMTQQEVPYRCDSFLEFPNSRTVRQINFYFL